MACIDQGFLPGLGRAAWKEKEKGARSRLGMAANSWMGNWEQQESGIMLKKTPKNPDLGILNGKVLSLQMG